MSADVVEGLELTLTALARYAGFKGVEDARESGWWVRTWEPALRALDSLLGRVEQAPNRFFEPIVIPPKPKQSLPARHCRVRHPLIGSRVRQVAGTRKNIGKEGTVVTNQGKSHGRPQFGILFDDGTERTVCSHLLQVLGGDEE